jgi:NAD(P)-dependent dehydrogenase (short-subunit alcohol dehydrogenase family)
MTSLQGKVALVTGASSGLGAAMALHFAREGAQVLAVARRADKLAELATQAGDAAGSIRSFRADVSRKEEVQTMVAEALAQFGQLDVLVNNAGMNDNFAAVGEMDDALWQQVMDLNLNAAFHACKAAMPHMLRRKGCIVNIASIGGTEGARSGVAYTVSKHALVAMTKHTAFSYAKAGLRCNVICPGPVETPMVQAAMALDERHIDMEGARRSNSGMKNIPRIGQPDEIASIACFLASDGASLVNGAVIVADAGWTAY